LSLHSFNVRPDSRPYEVLSPFAASNHRMKAQPGETESQRLSVLQRLPSVAS